MTPQIINSGYLHKRNGQSLLEYTAVIACIIAALVAMQFYICRAIQGRWRAASDQIGEQYAPGKVSGEIITTVNRDIATRIFREEEPTTPVDGKMGYATFKEETIHRDETIRTGEERLGPF